MFGGKGSSMSSDRETSAQVLFATAFGTHSESHVPSKLGQKYLRETSSQSRLHQSLFARPMKQASASTVVACLQDVSLMCFESHLRPV